MKKGRPKIPNELKSDKTKQIKVNQKFLNNLEILKKIYNINTNSKLIEHIINLELQRYNINNDLINKD